MAPKVEKIDEPHDGHPAPWPLRPKDLAVDSEELADVHTLLVVLAARFDSSLLQPLDRELSHRAFELCRRLMCNYGDHERWRTLPAANKRPPFLRF